MKSIRCYAYCIFLFLTTVGLTGCGPTPLIRPDSGKEPCRISKASEIRNSCGTSEHVEVLDTSSPSNGYSLQFVEIDDQGFFQNRGQADRAIVFAERKPRDGKERIYYVIYVHGWFHGAEMSDEHLPNFLEALEHLARWRPSGEVRGIYIGWHGTSWPDLPMLRYLTFWDRKNTSEEVGRGSLQEFLLQLESAIQRNGKQNKLVTIGHSFGGSVVFNSLSHTLVQRFIDGVPSIESKSTIATPRGYGDLVVLLNPAFEAMRFLPIFSMVNRFKRPQEGEVQPRITEFSNSGRPYFVVLSSEGDWATRVTFPVGRFFSTIWESHPEVHLNGLGSEHLSGWVLDRNTIGNFKQFASFEKLERAGGQDTAWTSLTPCPRPESGLWTKLSTSRKDIGSDSPEFPGTAFVLRGSSSHGDSPFLLTAVDESIIKDHTDIGKVDLVCWIVQLADD